LKPLEGVKVIDLSRLVPGPYCTRLLSDMGAEIVKVEEPGRGDYLRALPPYRIDVSIAFETLNRGKKSVAVNLESKIGRKILHKLVRKADVLLESFRPKTAKRLGCDFESIRKANPRIVHCSLTGFGETGPYRDMPGHDINLLGLSGFLDLNRTHDPVVPGIQVGDLAGGMVAAFAIASALSARRRTKRAQHIDTSILDALLSWLDIPLALHLGEGRARMLAGHVPFYRLYRTSDSKLMALGAIEPQFWEKLCKIIGRTDLLADQFSADPRRTEVIRVIEACFATKTRDEWSRIMMEHEMPCTPVLTLEESIEDPQTKSRKMIGLKATTPTEVTYIGNPCKIPRPETIRPSPSPKLGEHSVEVLREIGYSSSSIKTFIQTGVISRGLPRG